MNGYTQLSALKEQVARIVPIDTAMSFNEPYGMFHSWELTIDSVRGTCPISVWWEDEYVVSLSDFGVRELFDADDQNGAFDLIERTINGNVALRKSDRGGWYVDTGRGKPDDEVIFFSAFE